jgi:hypothetical protein
MFLYGIALLVIGVVGWYITANSWGSAPGCFAATFTIGLVLVCTSIVMDITRELKQNIVREALPHWQTYVVPAQHSYQNTVRRLSR